MTTLVPLLGLLVIIALAWCLSLERAAIRLRPVAVAIALQFVLALTILRRDGWSFVGMSLLALWLALYALTEPTTERTAIRRRIAIGLPTLAVTGYLLSRLPFAIAAWTLAASAAAATALALTARAGSKRSDNWTNRAAWRRLRPWCGALIPVSAAAAMQAAGVHGRTALETVGRQVTAFLGLADYGSIFLFGNLADERYYVVGPEAGWPGFGFLFAFKMLPIIVFFAAFVAVLYHLGVMQVVIESLSRFMRWAMGTSGAETLSTSANIFIGQTEAPLLIRPYLETTTRSELLTIMVGGFATVAGGALAGYIAMGIPAAHLIAASVMSAPAAIAIAKIVLPETEHPETAGDVALPVIDAAHNVIEAATNGIQDGLRLAVNVGAMLIGFIALVAVADVALNFADGWIDGVLLGGPKVEYGIAGLSPVTAEFKGVFPGSLQTLFGGLLRPLAWLLGVPWSDAFAVGNLLGIKLSLNEFVAYGTLSGHLQTGVLGQRAIDLSAYALCGFANFASIGIQIGGLGALAPGRKKELAALGLRAMLAGALASMMTASIAALFI